LHCDQLQLRSTLPSTISQKGQLQVNTLTEHVNTVADYIHAKRSNTGQLVVAIAGAPGSGKSTVADEVARRLNQQKCPAIVVPMDGFHLDNAVLDNLGLTQKKGAPNTFDVSGFIRIIKSLREEGNAYFPRFDRSRDLSIAGALAVTTEQAVVIVEGNYLMYDAPMWRDLAPLWDVTVRIDVPLPELRARLIQRWLSLNYSRTVATRRAESNDIPNAHDVIARALPCDLLLSWHRQD
jgi:pantothenate kinase